MMDAVRRGAAILVAGQSSLDAVVASVMALEDHPLFNAGRGSVLNTDGRVEMDASVMVAWPAPGRRDPFEARAGAVAAITRVKNPIVLARAVMEHTGHVLMAGAGAEEFARTMGIALCRPQELVTRRTRERWRTRKLRRNARWSPASAHGTVGAVAVDRQGRIAAATSTGGVSDKMPGRVGDSAIIGAGTFAGAPGAASATGHGEAIIMTNLCREAVRALERGTPERIARRIISSLIVPLGSEAGIVLVDRRGRVGYAHNAESMEVGIFDSSGGFGHLWTKPI